MTGGQVGSFEVYCPLDRLWCWQRRRLFLFGVGNMGEGVHLNVSNLDTFLINVPILPVVDLPGGKDLAVPAPQSPCGVRVDTIFSYCSCFSGICVANFSKYLAKSPSKERYDSV